MKMKKKTKIILACIAACIIVAAVAVVIKVNLDKQAKNKSLTEGKTAIETYLQSFDEENEEGKKAEIYTSFQSDEKITSVIEKLQQNETKEIKYENLKSNTKYTIQITGNVQLGETQEDIQVTYNYKEFTTLKIPAK